LVLVNIIEGGSVKEIFTENGYGDRTTLACMYNQYRIELLTVAETAIIEQINNLNTGKLNIRNQELSLTKDLA
jgi:HlyD family secretion protein